MPKLPSLRTAALLLALSFFAFWPATAGVERWTPFGPAGTFGPMLAVTVLPGPIPTVLAAGESGLYRSTDGGRTWTWSGDGLAGTQVVRLVVAPTDPSVVLADAFGGFFRSDDAGRTWKLAYLSRSTIESLAFDPTDASVVYVGDGPDLLRSADGGETWERLFAGYTVIEALAIDPADPDTIYIGDLSTAYKSADAGATWSAIDEVDNSPLRIDDGVVALAIAPSAPDTVYLSGRFGQTYRSTDGGETWSLRSAVGGMIHLIVDPIRPGTLYGTGYESPFVQVSRDGGATWREIRQGLPFGSVLRVNGLAIDPATRKLFVATGDHGVPSIEAGRRWSLLPQSGLPADRVEWLKFHPDNPSRIFVRVATSPAEILESRDSGRTWQPFAPFFDGQSLEAANLLFDPASPNVFYVNAGGRFWRSVDDGRTWAPFGLENARSLLVTEQRTLLSGSCGLQRSADGGRTWPEVMPCTIPNPHGSGDEFNRVVQELLADPFEPATIYALVLDIGGRHPVESFLRLFISRDDGRTWSSLLDGPSSLSFDLSRPGTIYVLGNGGIRKSGNRGRDWQEVNTAGLGPLNSLVVDREDPETLYVSTAGRGVLRTTDGGATWNPINAGLARRSLTNVGSLIAHPTLAHRLYALTQQGAFEGFWPER